MVDAHSHVGGNDPSGFSASVDQLVDALAVVEAKAVVFPLTEPDGYRVANAAVRAAARDHGLFPFARIRPDDDPTGEARRAADSGGLGLKLHPSSDQFTVDDPALDGAHRIADEQGWPVMVHAGPEVSGVGRTVLDLAARHRDARYILAHAALTDLAWLPAELPAHPNVFVDTSWWSASDLVALFGLVPPGRILVASDLPYSTPLWASTTALRCARHAGLDDTQLASVLGAQTHRLITRAAPADLGPPPGPAPALDPLLERVHTYLAAAVEATKRGGDPGQPLTLAHHACQARDDHPNAPTFTAVLSLLTTYTDHAEALTTDNQYAPGWDLLAAAAITARTPGADHPTRPTPDP